MTQGIGRFVEQEKRLVGQKVGGASTKGRTSWGRVAGAELTKARSMPPKARSRDRYRKF